LVEELRMEDTYSAVNISQRHGFQYYDALILACAQRLGCQAVLSEDMQHGFVLDGKLTIVNPFQLRL
jgi:predicted nucleic acid-binding protein